MKKASLIIFLLILSQFGNKLIMAQNKVSVTYLGQSGWAIKHKNNFIIFDYQKNYDFKWDKQPIKNLASGYIVPDEIKDFNVYVFVSHEHSDHYDSVIFNWEKEIEHIKYFFGWEASDNPNYHCLKAPRSGYKDDHIEIFTINSHHSGVPESAFLIKIDGLTIYHNGDYKGDYVNDFKYLASKTDKIDISFSNSVRIENTQLFTQCQFMLDKFEVKHFFPMHSINKENGYEIFAKLLKNHGVKSEIHIATAPGDEFSL